MVSISVVFSVSLPCSTKQPPVGHSTQQPAKAAFWQPPLSTPASCNSVSEAHRTVHIWPVRVATEKHPTRQDWPIWRRYR